MNSIEHSSNQQMIPTNRDSSKVASLRTIMYYLNTFFPLSNKYMYSDEKEECSMFIIQVNAEIELKMMGHKDHQALFELIDRNRSYLRKWLPWVDENKTPAHSEQFITNAFENHANRTSLSAGIFYHGELVGVIGFNTYDWRNRIGTIGYWLGEEFQGKGIMTRATRALIDYGLGELDLNRLQLFAAVKNRSSRAIAERLGFTKEGIICEHEWLGDRFVDHVLYRLLKSEWVHLHHKS